MIGGYPYFRKPPHGNILAIAVSAGKCSIYFHNSLHIIYQLIRIQSRSGDRSWVSTKDAVEHEGLQSELLQILLEPLSVSLSLLGAIIPGKKRPGYCTYIYIYLNLPLVHKNVYHFFSARFQKMCPFKGLKKNGVRSSVALHSNQLDSFPKGSIGHFCHALMRVQHVKYDLEQPRLTTWVASQHM